MIKEFSDNVQRLFDESVHNKSVQSCQTSVDLLAVLRRKVTLPILVTTNDSCAHVIYDNVSVTLDNDMSNMNIAYNSDYQMTFHNLSSCDLHQLSEFILALERDIPKWRHIWVADDKLRKEKAKIGERLKSCMRQFRSDWMSIWTHNDEKMVERFRIKYYNLQACKMCLENDNPFWENKNSEAEILEECQTLHMNPPMEQWYTDFTDFIDECKQMRDERDRQREEQKQEQEKARHIIRIRQLKFEAIIKSVEFHPGFNVSVESHLPQQQISFSSRQSVYSMGGYFLIRFKINGASTFYRVYFNDVDRCTPAIINAITRINDIIPELINTLIDDGQQYYLMGDDLSMGPFFENRSAEPFAVVRYSFNRKRVIRCPQLPSHRVARRINTVIRELYTTTYNNDKKSK